MELFVGVGTLVSMRFLELLFQCVLLWQDEGYRPAWGFDAF
jgi:hypothetical protein